jgi:hypothetical protein
MAGKDEKKANISNGSKGRLQIFVAGFAVEGNDSVLADGFKAIRDLTEAMKHSGVLAPAPRVRAVLSGGAETSKPGAPRPEVVEPEAPDQPAEVAVEDVEASEEEQRPTNGSGTGSKRSYSYKTPAFLNDLDITKAKKGLKEFVAEKNPPDVMSKYLVVVYWLQKYLDIAEVKIDHVYTVFDLLGWKADMPANPSVPLRDLKSKRHMLTRETGVEGYKVNFKGEQEVEKMK